MNTNATTPVSNGHAATRADAVPSAPALPKLYLRKDELAAALRVSERTIENWMKGRAIPFIKVGRTVLFRPGDVDRALQHYTFRAVGEERTM